LVLGVAVSDILGQLKVTKQRLKETQGGKANQQSSSILHRHHPFSVWYHRINNLVQDPFRKAESEK
jgi:hypothetical protein